MDTNKHSGHVGECKLMNRNILYSEHKRRPAAYKWLSLSLAAWIATNMSWYAEKHPGAWVASNKYKPGTVVEIENVANGKRCTGTVIGTGPFAVDKRGRLLRRNGKLIPHPTRGLDASPRVMKSLTSRGGVIRVRYRVVAQPKRGKR